MYLIYVAILGDLIISKKIVSNYKSLTDRHLWNLEEILKTQGWSKFFFEKLRSPIGFQTFQTKKFEMLRSPKIAT